MDAKIIKRSLNMEALRDLTDDQINEYFSHDPDLLKYVIEKLGKNKTQGVKKITKGGK